MNQANNQLAESIEQTKEYSMQLSEVSIGNSIAGITQYTQDLSSCCNKDILLETSVRLNN